jgi:EamA domain-containing membrane protein RarD
VIYGVLAYLMWGVIPIYFMAVRFASAPEVLAHRIVWSAMLAERPGRWQWIALAIAAIGVGHELLVQDGMLLTIVGFLQYLSPSVALVIAILAYDETMRPGQLLTFACIWLALLIFSGEGLYDRYDRYDRKCHQRRGKPA